MKRKLTTVVAAGLATVAGLAMMLAPVRAQTIGNVPVEATAFNRRWEVKEKPYAGGVYRWELKARQDWRDKSFYYVVVYKNAKGERQGDGIVSISPRPGSATQGMVFDASFPVVDRYLQKSASIVVEVKSDPDDDDPAEWTDDVDGRPVDDTELRKEYRVLRRGYSAKAGFYNWLAAPAQTTVMVQGDYRSAKDDTLYATPVTKVTPAPTGQVKLTLYINKGQLPATKRIVVRPFGAMPKRKPPEPEPGDKPNPDPPDTGDKPKPDPPDSGDKPDPDPPRDRRGPGNGVPWLPPDQPPGECIRKPNPPVIVIGPGLPIDCGCLWKRFRLIRMCYDFETGLLSLHLAAISDATRPPNVLALMKNGRGRTVGQEQLDFDQPNQPLKRGERYVALLQMPRPDLAEKLWRVVLAER